MLFSYQYLIGRAEIGNALTATFVGKEGKWHYLLRGEEQTYCGRRACRRVGLQQRYAVNRATSVAG